MKIEDVSSEELMAVAAQEAKDADKECAGSDAAVCSLIDAVNALIIVVNRLVKSKP